MKRGLLLIALILGSVAVPARAQTSAAVSGFDARGTVGAILLAGLVGGVLGLSTLSFYDRPQDNIRNITIGAGTGMIISALYLTFAMASGPRPLTQMSPPLELPSTVVYPVASNRAAGVGFLRRF
jgi:hypothetical protein